MNRVLTLDGWRGVAVLLVILEHVGRESLSHQAWAAIVSLGVNIFFVISGYIITARLIEERESSSAINLSSFYVRRAFRILPLVFTYLFVLCLLSLFLKTEVRSSQVAGALFFFRNYQYAAHPIGIYTAHFWSLSIEEHFYLLWPAILLWSGNRRAVWIAPIGAVACALWRIYDYTHPDGPIGRLLPGVSTGLRQIRTDTRMDGLLVGCTLALLLSRPSIRAFILKNFPKETPLFGAILLFILQLQTYGYMTLTSNLLIALMMASTLVVHEGLAFKWLNSRLLVQLGTISYSLYVWQQLFLQHPDDSRPLGVLSTFPWNVICAVAVATCSYYCIERPIVRIGKQMTRRNAPDAVETAVEVPS